MTSWLTQRLQSFSHAFRGAATLISTQQNARIHLAATVAIMTAGWWFDIHSGEWIAISISISMVWCAEALNTAIEFLADEITLEKRDRIKLAKDVAAFAVLVVAISSMAVALFIFGPRVLW